MNQEAFESLNHLSFFSFFLPVTFFDSFFIAFIVVASYNLLINLIHINQNQLELDERYGFYQLSNIQSISMNFFVKYSYLKSNKQSIMTSFYLLVRLQFAFQLIKMYENTHQIQLSPWISPDKTYNKALPFNFTIEKQRLSSKQVILITVLSIKPQTLSLLGTFSISANDQNNKQNLAFISSIIQVQEQSFQIAYVPHRESKTEVDCLLSISDMLKAVSEVVITDVSCNGAHKYKERRPSQSSEGKQFVIVSNKDVYQIENKENKIELSKKTAFSLGMKNWSMPDMSTNPKSVRLDLLGNLFEEYAEQFCWFLNSDKNMRTLAQVVLARYNAQRHISDCFGLEWGKTQKKMYTIGQMKTIQNEIINNADEQKNEIVQWIAQKITNRLKNDNSNKVCQLLLDIRRQFAQRQVQDQDQLNILTQQAVSILRNYQIDDQFATFLLSSHQQSLLERQNQNLIQKEQILKELVMQRNNELMLKAHKIDQLKQMLREFADKAEEMKQNTQQLIEVSQLLEQQRQKNWKLQLEVESHVFIAKKNADSKLALENEIQSLLKQKGDLLLALQELTSENLTLMGQRETLQQSLSQLKQRVQDSSQIQARALRSIQNQAQIKVRLSRYQNYVQELKQVFNSFKRLEIQKFNYVLQHNYKEYSQLQQRLKCTQFDLRRSQARVKELTQSLHCERVKMGYFQMYASNYPNETIPEVSQENSVTDRQGGQSS